MGHLSCSRELVRALPFCHITEGNDEKEQSAGVIVLFAVVLFCFVGAHHPGSGGRGEGIVPTH